MTHPSEIGPEQEPNKEVFWRLAGAIDGVFFEAFEDVARQGGRVYSETVQFDAISIEDEVLYSVLMSGSGVKPTKGAETMRFLARPVDDSITIRDAAERFYLTGEKPYKTDEFFADIRQKDGSHRYYEISNFGMNPWKSRLADLPTEELVNVDFIGAVQRDSSEQIINLELLDRQFAKKILARMHEGVEGRKWSIIPQN